MRDVASGLPHCRGLRVAGSSGVSRDVRFCFCGAAPPVVWNFMVWPDLGQQRLVIFPGSQLPSQMSILVGPAVLEICQLSTHNIEAMSVDGTVPFKLHQRETA